MNIMNRRKKKKEGKTPPSEGLICYVMPRMGNSMNVINEQSLIRD